MTDDLERRVREDLKVALKAGEAPRVGTLRMVLSEMRNREIEKGRGLTPDEAIALIASGIKSRQESVEQFRAGGRGELADREAGEIEILRAYLPSQLSAEELSALVDQAVSETGASSVREMGKVMAWLMPRLRGRADGAELSRRVK
ncbi:MAG: GatB/YqeY domain-containing protein, partial [Gemmatimonadetes bacterium]|nr:GatB/YqeY domain-containing protein [Gemmatimonadota bacterium]